MQLLILTNSRTLSKIKREVCDIYVNDNHHATVDVEDAEEIFWWWIFKTRKSQSFRKSKGYMYIVFILRALLIFYTRIQYLWYTQSIYFYFIFFLSLCFIFLHYSSVKLFSSFRPVLECTNFSITWCSKQKRVFNHLLHFAYSSPDRRTYVHGVMRCTTNSIYHFIFFR